MNLAQFPYLTLKPHTTLCLYTDECTEIIFSYWMSKQLVVVLIHTPCILFCAWAFLWLSTRFCHIFRFCSFQFLKSALRCLPVDVSAEALCLHWTNFSGFAPWLPGIEKLAMSTFCSRHSRHFARHAVKGVWLRVWDWINWDMFDSMLRHRSND